MQYIFYLYSNYLNIVFYMEQLQLTIYKNPYIIIF